MRFISEAYSLSKLYLIKSRRLSPGQEKNLKFEMLGERWLKSGMGKIDKGVTKRQRAIMLRDTDMQYSAREEMGQDYSVWDLCRPYGTY